MSLKDPAEIGTQEPDLRHLRELNDGRRFKVDIPDDPWEELWVTQE